MKYQPLDYYNLDFLYIEGIINEPYDNNDNNLFDKQNVEDIQNEKDKQNRQNRENNINFNNDNYDQLVLNKLRNTFGKDII